MFISLGPEKTVKKEEVVGIFDLDTGASTKATKDFLKKAEKNGKTETAGYDIPKSFVLLRDGTVVFSKYSSKVVSRFLKKAPLSGRKLGKDFSKI